MRHTITILIVYLLINRCHAEGLTRASGGRSAAMGGTSVCEQSIWALQNNPAGLATMKGWHFGLYYENQWLLKETAFKSGGLAKRVSGIGCFGLSVCQYGWSQFSQNLFSIAYARDFGPYLQMGLRADWIWLHLGEAYPDRTIPGFELGIQSQVTEKLRLGASLFNPLNSKLKTLNEDALPVVMKVGLSYQFTEDFIGQLEVEKDSQRPGVRLGGGLEYTLFERFQIRAGAQHNPNILSFGVGYLVRSFQVDIAAQMHQALGASLQIGMGYNIP
ncbi:MAG: hypothetical protein K5920_09850 [Bacteroidales bacterium]|nr:hypothetical protein [Bacteroidales bacterium]